MNLLTVGSTLAVAMLAGPSAMPGGQVAPPKAHPHGQSYSEWSESFWQWFLEHPIAGHPGIDDPQFDVTSGQSGQVWYLSTLVDFGPAVPHTRVVDVPVGKALFVGLLNYEASDLEGFPDEISQRDFSNFIMDHVTALDFTVDGQAVDIFGRYRVESDQFDFTAPTPWIFGPAGEGQPGTAVADGYYAFINPMSVGQHTLRCTGNITFAPGELGPEAVEFNADMTYVVNVR
jgi:hypothetical protein